MNNLEPDHNNLANLPSRAAAAVTLHMLPVLLRWVRRSGFVLSPQSDLLSDHAQVMRYMADAFIHVLSTYGIKLKIKQIAMFIVQFFRTLIRKWVYI